MILIHKKKLELNNFIKNYELYKRTFLETDGNYYIQLEENNKRFIDKAAEEKINELILDIDNLPLVLKIIIAKPEKEIRDYLQKLFFSKMEDDITQTSLLIHLFHKTNNEESQYYILRTLPSIHNELTFWFLLKLQNSFPENIGRHDSGALPSIFTGDFLNDFKNPNFSELIKYMVFDKFNLFDKQNRLLTSIDNHNFYILFDYLLYCYSQKTLEQDYIKNILLECISRKVNPEFYINLSCIVEDYNFLSEIVNYILEILDYLSQHYKINSMYDNYTFQRHTKINENGIAWTHSKRQFYEMDEIYIIYSDLIRSLKSLIQTLGVLENNNTAIEGIFNKIEMSNSISSKNKDSISSHIAKSRYKQQRIISKKIKKKYKNPNQLHRFEVDENLIQILTRLRLRDYNFKKSSREFENEIREELGIPKIGEGWKNETLLFRLITSMLEKEELDVFHHYRPKYLKGQEYDIYFEYNNQKYGVEYQGLQHFEAVDYFGGEEALKKSKERDKRKLKLSIENNVNLIYFYHYEQLSISLVRNKLKIN